MRKDLFGDPLPPGALARLGTQRLCYPNTEFLAFSGDGKLLAAADTYGGVHVADVKTGREIHRFQALPDFRYSQTSLLVFSPDSNLLAFGERENRVFFRKLPDPKKTLRIWSVKAGKELHRLEAGNVAALAFSPESDLLASAGFDGSFRIWDTMRGVTTREWNPSRPISYLEFAADGKSLISGERDQSGRSVTFREWDIATAKERRTQTTDIDTAYRCCLSPHALLFAVPAKDGRSIRLLSPTTGKEMGLLKDSQYPIILSFSSDAKKIAAGSNDGIIRVWDTSSGKALYRFQGPKFIINRVALSPDGKLLASAADALSSSEIDLWDLAQGKKVHVFPGHRIGPLTLAFSTDGKRVISTSREPGESSPIRSWADWSIRQWDAASGKELGRLEADSEGQVRRNVFSQDGTRLAVVNDKGILRLWDLVGSKELSRWQAPITFTTHTTGKIVKKYPRPAITGLFFLPDKKTILITSLGESSFRDYSGKELRKLERRKANTFEICVLSADGKLMAISEFTGRRWEVCFQETETGREISRLPGYRQPWTMALSPDGRTLVTADGTATPDGKMVASIRLWEVASGGERCRFEGNPESVFALAFSPNGKILASGGDPGEMSIRLWEVASGKQLGGFAGHRSRHTSLVFSPNGRLLASGSYDNTALVWDVDGAVGNKATPVVKLAPKELEILWTNLASGNASLAYQAIGMLTRGGDDPVAYLVKNLQKSPKTELERIDQWLADLDSGNFAVRQKASEFLAKAGNQAEPALRKLLEGSPSLEVRRRVEALLSKMNKLEIFSEHWRMLRTVEVLEHLGTAEARKALRSLAQGQPKAFLARESQAALDRLDKMAP